MSGYASEDLKMMPRSRARELAREEIKNRKRKVIESARNEFFSRPRFISRNELK